MSSLCNSNSWVKIRSPVTILEATPFDSIYFEIRNYLKLFDPEVIFSIDGESFFRVCVRFGVFLFIFEENVKLQDTLRLKHLLKSSYS